MLRRSLAAAGLLVVLAASPAAAHPGIFPPTVPTGVQSLTVAVPSEPPAGATAMTGIDIALPDGLTALQAQAGSTFPSVTVVDAGRTVQARGATLTAGSTGFVFVQVDIRRTGAEQLVVTALHDDGARTVWDGAPGTDTYSPPLTVTAAARSFSVPTPLLVGGGTLIGALVLAGSYELTRRRRRRA